MSLTVRKIDGAKLKSIGEKLGDKESTALFTDSIAAITSSAINGFAFDFNNKTSHEVATVQSGMFKIPKLGRR